ncbi:Tartrate-resistant acid phosphatase type 5 [Globisporangium polare]
MAVGKRAIVIGAILVVAIVGAIVAIMLSVKSSHASAKGAPTVEAAAEKHRDGGRSGTHPSGKRPLSTFDGLVDSNTTANSTEKIIESDPLTENFAVTALAIGDWGRTVQKEGGSCCQRRKSYSVLDLNAMEYTASLLGLAAQQLQPKPAVIIGHGDNFYWTGLQSASDQAYRFHETFESKYADASLAGISWVNVLGNHDYGGASFLCSSGDVPAKCGSTQEMLASLQQKFALQSQYVSPHANRWILSDHFYVHNIADPVANISIDIFNIDTNDADTHGARQICCQCYGYAGGEDDLCEEVVRDHQYCAGGDGGMYDVCVKQLNDWGLDSRKRLAEAAKKSTATWKLVNSHYSPYNHFAPEHAQEWRELLDGLGINLFIYGHTHGGKHDYASFKTHFIENGAGGGIQNESPSGIPPFAEDYVQKIWAAGGYPYGIFSLKASINWLEVRFLTFDDAWVMNKELSTSKVGGVATKHCWFIPRHGGKGKSCEDAQTAAA